LTTSAVFAVPLASKVFIMTTAPSMNTTCGWNHHFFESVASISTVSFYPTLLETPASQTPVLPALENFSKETPISTWH
jgi:hypothetical protein